MDGLGRRTGELLMGDRAYEGGEVCLGGTGEGGKAGVLDQTGDHRVAPGQNAGRLAGTDLASRSGRGSARRRAAWPSHVRVLAFLVPPTLRPGPRPSPASLHASRPGTVRSAPGAWWDPRSCPDATPGSR